MIRSAYSISLETVQSKKTFCFLLDQDKIRAKEGNGLNQTIISGSDRLIYTYLAKQVAILYSLSWIPYLVF
jgi:hypothetical protein